jgi:hypothetical protein
MQLGTAAGHGASSRCGNSSHQPVMHTKVSSQTSTAAQVCYHTRTVAAHTGMAIRLGQSAMTVLLVISRCAAISSGLMQQQC